MDNLFDSIEKSLEVTNGNIKKKFSTLDDYINCLIKKNRIPNNKSFYKDELLLEKVYRHWQSKDQVACKFAQILALNPKKYGLYVSIIDNLKNINTEIEKSIKNKKTEGLTLLFPNIKSNEELVELCSFLETLDGWNVQYKYNPSDKYKRVYLNIQVKISERAEAEVLGFGAYQYLPITRQSPLTALEIRIKEDNPKFISPNKLSRVHLASLPLIDWEEKQLKSVWKKTEEQREKMLGGDDSVAKAKVCFVIPQEIFIGIDV